MGLSPVRETNRVGHNVSWLGSNGEDTGRSMSPRKTYPRKSRTNPELLEYCWGIFEINRVLYGVAILLFVLVMPEN